MRNLVAVQVAAALQAQGMTFARTDTPPGHSSYIVLLQSYTSLHLEELAEVREGCLELLQLAVHNFNFAL